MGTFIKDGVFYGIGPNDRYIMIPSEVNSISLDGYEDILGMRQVLGIDVEKGNENFVCYNNCLVAKKSKCIIKGCEKSQIPDSEDVEVIGRSAFCDMPNCFMPIPKNIKIIGDTAFKNTALVNVFIHENIEKIGKCAFGGARPAEKMTVHEKNKFYYSQNNCIIEKATKKLVACSKDAVIPDGVENIEALTFLEFGMNYEEYSVITFPKSVKNIRRYFLNLPIGIEFPIVIKAPEESYAAWFAEENEIPLITI